LAISLAKSNSISPARLAAFEILRRVEDGAYASVLLAAKEPSLAPLDRALCHELVMGVLRRQLWLDRLAEFYSNRKVGEMDLEVRLALRLALYQLRFLSRVPASAAVNESVNLVYYARLRSAGSMVNAVLRRATRDPDIDPSLAITDPIEKIAVATSHPFWLIERWVTSFGRDEAEALAHANNEPAPVAFRVVAARAKEAAVVDRLRESGATVTPSTIANGAWRVTQAGSLLPKLVTAGEIYIQDEASQLVASVLDVKPGEKVLDLCAAPGSKATQIADRAGDGALIVAGDIHEHRLRTVVNTVRAHGLKSIHCVALDGLQQLPFENEFDRVLVDAPCSGTGTLRRNPEIRWRISPAAIEDLSRRQTQLLVNASQFVKPSGRLVYSTCSVEADENEDVVRAFLEKGADFQSTELALDPSLRSGSGARTWPHRHDTDGFFIQAFRRVST
jgi:16S rRNA (cytosine967-C5)-methyltransferase